MRLDELKAKRVVIAGLGVNNRHLARYFDNCGIKYAVIDRWQNPEELSGKFDGFDIVFRTPGLPYLCKAVQEAKRRGILIYSQTKLFFDLCPGPIIGVTGTKGKGTTATLICEILNASGKRTRLGGNIGSDPFEFLGEIANTDWTVLELSSFQLQDLHKSPQIAVVLKITPEHLDYHRDFQEYTEAKEPIVLQQSPQDFAVLNYDNEITRAFATLTPACVVWNSVVSAVSPGCFVADQKIILHRQGEKEVVVSTADVKLLGDFNLENVTAAIGASAAAGAADPKVLKKVIGDFLGLPHRLEFTAEIKGVRFYNDSFSTTPETAIAALSAFRDPIILIAGGSEKNADYSKLGEAIARRPVKILIAIGTTGPKIAAAARRLGYNGQILDQSLPDMERIVAVAHRLAKQGDIVLLSPASASFDMFKDYKHRGELFKKFVNKLHQ